jgi:hypothetical protein
MTEAFFCILRSPIKSHPHLGFLSLCVLLTLMLCLWSPFQHFILNVLPYVVSVSLLVISSLTCNLLFKTFKYFKTSKSLVHQWFMHTACLDRHWSSSGVSKIADETAVLSPVSSIFGICPCV